MARWALIAAKIEPLIIDIVDALPTFWQAVFKTIMHFIVNGFDTLFLAARFADTSYKYDTHDLKPLAIEKK